MMDEEGNLRIKPVQVAGRFEVAGPFNPLQTFSLGQTSRGGASICANRPTAPTRQPLLQPAATAPTLAETQEERMACTPDAQTLCADEIPDREKVYSCLVKKVNDLSPACKKIISAAIGPASKAKK
jgi:hypothetical protein